MSLFIEILIYIGATFPFFFFFFLDFFADAVCHSELLETNNGTLCLSSPFIYELTHISRCNLLMKYKRIEIEGEKSITQPETSSKINVLSPDLGVYYPSKASLLSVILRFMGVLNILLFISCGLFNMFEELHFILEGCLLFNICVFGMHVDASFSHAIFNENLYKRFLNLRLVIIVRKFSRESFGNSNKIKILRESFDNSNFIKILRESFDKIIKIKGKFHLILIKLRESFGNLNKIKRKFW